MGKRRLGFTLVEVILAMTLMGIMATVAVVLMGRALDAYNLVNSRIEASEEARYGLLRMVKEITVVQEIRHVDKTSFGFRDSLGADADFHLDGQTLYRGSDRLARNIVALEYTFYKQDGKETKAAPQVRRIHIEMTALAEGANGTIDLRTDVFPRNFLYDDFQQ